MSGDVSSQDGEWAHHVGEMDVSWRFLFGEVGGEIFC